MIPRAVNFRRDHIPISLSKLQPVSYTVWQKKYAFDKLALTIYVLLKLHSVADLIPLISREVTIERFTTQQEATKVMHKA